jgi:phage shock protein B
MNEELIVPVLAFMTLFVALPWIVFHYITKWKTAATLTKEDENLLDELHELARRLDERICSVERILTAENPNWRAVACDPVEAVLQDRLTETLAPVSRSNRPARRAR